jgi:hypothetical protein
MALSWSAARPQHPSDYLPSLRAEFPGYMFAIQRVHGGLSLVAIRVDDDTDGPLMVITSDVAELRECLTGSHQASR